MPEPPALPPARAFDACPRCRAALPPRETLRAIECAACGFCLYFNVGLAVAGFLLDAQGQALFLRRAREPSKGKLGLPGGFVDPGESAEAALHREVDEETGLTLTRIAFLASFPNTYPYRGILYPTVDLYFLAAAQGALRLQPREVEAVLWRDPATLDLSEVAFDSLRAALDAYRTRAPSARFAP